MSVASVEARYGAAIAQLFALQARGVRMGVARMRSALRYRRFDVHAMPYVIVAGTNGKGSVSAMIATALSAAGHRTGLFTSPHLHRFTERIRIDGRPIGTREATQRIEDVLSSFARPRAPQVTFFELSTLLAVEAFRDHGCDVAVLEVGLGGRLDATHALPAKLDVITNIAFDHMEYLGDTIAKIAAEKAGILEPGVPLVTGVRDPEALRVIEARARRLGARVFAIDRDFTAQSRAASGAAGMKLALRGEHQLDNAACAVRALRELRSLGLRVPETAIARGLARVRWPGRLERIAGAPGHLLDCAHNLDGARALAHHLEHGRSRGKRVLVFGAMRDKEYRAMLETLAPRFDRIVYAAPKLARAATPAELSQAVPGLRATSVRAALARARKLAGPRGEVIVAGSIFLVAEARALLLHVRADPLIRG